MYNIFWNSFSWAVFYSRQLSVFLYFYSAFISHEYEIKVWPTNGIYLSSKISTSLVKHSASSRDFCSSVRFFVVWLFISLLVFNFFHYLRDIYCAYYHYYCYDHQAQEWDKNMDLPHTCISSLRTDIGLYDNHIHMYQIVCLYLSFLIADPITRLLSLYQIWRLPCLRTGRNFSRARKIS